MRNPRSNFGLQINIQQILMSNQIKSKHGTTFIENVENFVTKHTDEKNSEAKWGSFPQEKIVSLLNIEVKG